MAISVDLLERLHDQADRCAHMADNTGAMCAAALDADLSLDAVGYAEAAARWGNLALDLREVVSAQRRAYPKIPVCRHGRAIYVPCWKCKRGER